MSSYNSSQAVSDRFNLSTASVHYAQRHITTLPPISPIRLHQRSVPIDQERDAKQSDDEEIEANLLKLGGQMAGSILDF